MKVQYDNGPNRTRAFVRKNSGSLIIHEGVLKNTLFSRSFNFERILTKIYVSDGHFLWFDMIEHPFLSIPAKTACPGKLRLIFSKISRATRLSDFMSSLLPLTIKHSNRFLYNVLVSQEVTLACMLMLQHNIATISSLLFWWSQEDKRHACCLQYWCCTHIESALLRVPTGLKGTDRS